ncbi:MAG TPA: hypothetical protein VNI20_09435 [Fimbriimonadaceae bacterium]|nr:hypothetical protein [Fimbriimonadaceae bacterium]
MNPASPETHGEVKRAIVDQLDIISSHVQSRSGMDAAFVREHALNIVQLAESLIPGGSRPYGGVRPSADAESGDTE